MAGNYYDREFEPWTQGIRNIGSMLAQMPELRAQAQERAQRARLLQARSGLATSETGTANAKTQDLIRKGTLVDAFQRYVPQAQQDLAAGITDSEAIRGASSAMGGLTGQDPKTITGGFLRMTQAIKAAKTGDATAAFAAASDKAVPAGAAVTDDQQTASLANALARAKAQGSEAAQIRADAPIALGDDKALVSADGTVLNPGVHTLKPGGRMFAPPNVGYDLDEAPVAEGAPPPPHSAAVDSARARFVATVMTKTGLDGMAPAYTPAQQNQMIADFDAAMGNSGTAAPANKPTSTAAGQVNQPTRALAKQYVDKYGAKAKAQLQADGYDTTGYAD